jgi:putative nucleotidyltransferase with HDIG domain
VSARPAPSPRLLVRALVATFAAIVAVLAAVFVTLLMDSQARVTRAVVANLDAGRRAFSTLERRRQNDLILQAATLAESPTLKAALDTYQSERQFAPADSGDVLRSTVGHEVAKLAARVPVDALVVLDREARVIASAGPHARQWPPAGTVHGVDPAAGATDRVVLQGGRPYHAVGVPLALHGEPIGVVVLATSLDAKYAREVADLSRARTAVVLDGRVIASTLGGPVAQALDAAAGRLPEQGVLPLAGEQHAIGRLFRAGTAEVYAVDSLDAAAAGARREALETLALIGLGALGLGAAASLWLARTLARPIKGLSHELRVMAATRAFTRRLPASGSSEELDALADTFNELMASLRAAEEQTELAYLGAIKALAAALDARDPYTAGHSERVSALSVMLGEQLGLAAEDLEVLRLGGLLHDIGKIGIRDKVLTKNGPLTDEEYEVIKTHPTVGAHILRQIPMLAAHLPIVELHHERPDGRGYPYGLVGPATPLLARIVHVADAFDAMTSARAYRPAQSTDFAIDELCRHRGSQFDPEVVDAFLAAWAIRRQPEGRPVLTAIEAAADAGDRASLPRAVGE